MFLLSLVVFTGLPFLILGWMSCPQSIPTVSIVSRCPSDAKEWMMAAKKKDCGTMQKYQNCSNDGSFVYHCVLNEDATMLLEVCAPIWYMSGYCARFSITNKRLVNNPSLDCTKSPSPCPARFPSNESFKYQMCYQNVTLKGSPQALHNEQEQSSGPGLLIVLVIFVLTTLCLGILLIFWKMKGFLTFGAADTTQGDLNAVTWQGEEEPLVSIPRIKGMKLLEVDSEDNGEDADKERMLKMLEICATACLRSLKLEELLWIVNRDNGTLYKEDTEINAEKSTSYTLMKGNKNSESGLKERCTAKCRMDCGHLAAEETLLGLVRDTLPETEYVELKCPLCSTIWKKDDLIRKCNMSKDEILFFELVLGVNEKNEQITRAISKELTKQLNHSKKEGVSYPEYVTIRT